MAAPKEQCERLHLELLSALKEQVTISNKLQTSKKQLKAVRRERNDLQQAADSKKAETKKISYEYARAGCNALCEEVYNRFPREVRNMIYNHIHPRYQLNVGPSYFKLLKAEVPKSGWKTFHHIWEPSFVTSKVHAELVEQFYRSTTFEFYTSFECIAKFRVTDQWKIDYVPAQFPTTISVAIDCSHYNLDLSQPDNKDDGEDGWNAYSDWGHPPRPPKKASSDLLADLDVLFGFHSATKLNILIRFDHKRKGNHLKKQDWMRKYILPLVAPTLRRLQSSGYHVQVTLDGCCRPRHDFPDFVIGSFTSLESCSAQFEEFMSKEQKAYEEAKLEAREEGEGSSLNESDDSDSD